MMKEKRQSNKLKQKQLETKYLEEQTKKMEDKLSQLKKQIQQQKKLKAEAGLDNTLTRWQKTAKTTAPLKSYAKQILEQQKIAHKQFGINPKRITGTKTFSGVLQQLKQEKEQEQERNPTKITTFLKQPEEDNEPALLSNNFFKAKMDVKKLIKQKTLEEFLQENFIIQYLPLLRDEGIHDLEALRYVSRQQLAEMGVKTGHQVKIVKKIKEQFDKLLQGKYEGPKEEEKIQKGQKVQFGYGQNDIHNYSLTENAEIEQIQVPTVITHQKQRVQEEDDEQLQEQQQDEVMITIPTVTASLQAEEFCHCFECYRLIISPLLHHQQKYFCSELCLQKYFSQLRKHCPSCGVTFIKTDGFHEQGLWFCSLGCCPNHEEIEQMFFQWHQQSS